MMQPAAAAECDDEDDEDDDCWSWWRTRAVLTAAIDYLQHADVIRSSTILVIITYADVVSQSINQSINQSIKSTGWAKKTGPFLRVDNF